MLYLTVSLFTLVTVALCAPENMLEPDRHESSTDLNMPVHMHEDSDDQRIAKRSPAYDFGLGKRAYSYVSEYKRLPVYNFGLGKRSRLYSFGLGKRSVDAAAEEDTWDTDPNHQEALADLLDHYEQYDDEVVESKRARPYSFGLGKRFTENDATDQDKRARMYEFGLGKRAPLYNFGLGKRLNPRQYSFGLGKRLSPGRLYSFGLGKRERDMNRFNFGLGKRSVDEADFETDEADA